MSFGPEALFLVIADGALMVGQYPFELLAFEGVSVRRRGGVLVVLVLLEHRVCHGIGEIRIAVVVHHENRIGGAGTVPGRQIAGGFEIGRASCRERVWPYV